MCSIENAINCRGDAPPLEVHDRLLHVDKVAAILHLRPRCADASPLGHQVPVVEIVGLDQLDLIELVVVSSDVRLRAHKIQKHNTSTSAEHRETCLRSMENTYKNDDISLSFEDDLSMILCTEFRHRVLCSINRGKRSTGFVGTCYCFG